MCVKGYVVHVSAKYLQRLKSRILLGPVELECQELRAVRVEVRTELSSLLSQRVSHRAHY